MSTLNGGILIPILQMKKPRLSSSPELAQLPAGDAEISTPYFAVDGEPPKKWENVVEYQQKHRPPNTHTFLTT